MRGFSAGLLAGVAISAVAMGGGRFVTTAYGMGGAEGQATYKVLLENERVRVREAVFPPGALNTGTHTHEYAHVGVILTKGSLVFTNPDGTSETVPFESGSVGFREAKATHAVGNPGPEPMRVIEVELK
jgi:oxalate decarboxylase/phosphoglucose isomerase-like protein (cupin superfamily)